MSGDKFRLCGTKVDAIARLYARTSGNFHVKHGVDRWLMIQHYPYGVRMTYQIEFHRLHNPQREIADLCPTPTHLPLPFPSRSTVHAFPIASAPLHASANLVICEPYAKTSPSPSITEAAPAAAGLLHPFDDHKHYTSTIAV